MTPVHIERRDISTAAQLADLYASQMLECPYEYEVADDSFRDAVCQPVDGLSDQLLLVAMVSTQAMAFAHIGRGAADDGADVVGVIRSLVVPRGSCSNDVGQALLDAAHEHYDLLGLGDRTEMEVFVGPHTIHGVGTFEFLHRHLDWPRPEQGDGRDL